eukprot:788572-Amphidinium_carterae.1
MSSYVGCWTNLRPTFNWLRYLIRSSISICTVVRAVFALCNSKDTSCRTGPRNWNRQTIERLAHFLEKQRKKCYSAFLTPLQKDIPEFVIPCEPPRLGETPQTPGFEEVSRSHSMGCAVLCLTGIHPFFVACAVGLYSLALRV